MVDPVDISHKTAFDEKLISFKVHRADALSAYSLLEQALCGALAYFGEMPAFSAGVIFFRLNNVRSSIDILDKLKRQKIGASHSLYWDGTLNRWGALAETRNTIVHWADAGALYTDNSDNLYFKAALKPPNHLSWTPKTPELYEENLVAFQNECRFFQISTEAFVALLAKRLPAKEAETWREICAQAPTYPPPPDHPLYRRPIAPPPPPEASRE